MKKYLLLLTVTVIAGCGRESQMATKADIDRIEGLLTNHHNFTQSAVENLSTNQEVLGVITRANNSLAADIRGKLTNHINWSTNVHWNYGPTAP